MTTSSMLMVDERRQGPPSVDQDCPPLALQVLLVATLVCSISFLAYLPLPILRLRGRRRCFDYSTLTCAEAGIAVLLATIPWAIDLHLSPVGVAHSGLAPIVLASLLVSGLANAALACFVLYRRSRSSDPSHATSLHLLSCIVLDGLILTVPGDDGTHWVLRRRSRVHDAIILFRLIGNLALMSIESFESTPTPSRFSNDNVGKRLNPNSSRSLLNTVLFGWINKILWKGYTSILTIDDAPPLSPRLSCSRIRARMLLAWNARRRPETRMSLPMALLVCVKWDFMNAILPRLCLTLFKYSQPVLISVSIDYVTLRNHDEQFGYWLLVCAVVVYVGLALSTAIYQQQLNRLKLMTKSALVGLIHDKALNAPWSSLDDGRAVALMSTDAESLEGAAGMFHETWSQILEVSIGIILLAKHVGWLWPLPLVLILGCSRVSRWVAKHLHSRQRTWNMATQARLATTSDMLGSIKAIKMLGYTQSLTKRIQELRESELLAASRVRWMMVFYNASANALGLFTPALTLVLFAVLAAVDGIALDPKTAFTTIAVLSMVTHPANMIMTIVPRAVGAFAAFERIQQYLLSPSRCDNREMLTAVAPSRTADEDPMSSGKDAILLNDLDIGKSKPILKGVSLSLKKGSFTVVSGPVGCGKSVLLRAILGELELSKGSIQLDDKRVAYCSDREWLPSGTIRDIICGFEGHTDELRYRQVLSACGLDRDLASFTSGDATVVGSRGLNMSGGQRQRIALARAIYAKRSIVVLDDCFSALDGTTERQIFTRLFAANGLLRETSATVVLACNLTQYFELFDQVIILGDGRVQEHGVWADIRRKSPAVAKFVPQDSPCRVDTRRNDSPVEKRLRDQNAARMDLSRQTGDASLYGYYVGFAGKANLCLLLLCNALYAFFVVAPQFWLQLWTESRGRDTALYAAGFLLASLLAWSFTNGTMWTTIIRIAPRSGRRVHERLAHIVANAPLAFFTTVDSGSILSRFSQDLQLVDRQLPDALQSFFVQLFKLTIQTAVLFIEQKWLSLSLPLCLIVLYLVQKVYLRTSRQLRLLELESKAAIFTNFLESVEGVEVIRAFGWQSAVARASTECLETSYRAEYLLLSLQRWLNLVFDLLAGGLAVCIIGLAVALRASTSGGQVGVALNIMLVANQTLLKLVESWTALEISLGAMARLKTLEQETPSELDESRLLEPPDWWPPRGQVEFKSLSCSYGGGHSSRALTQANLSIGSGNRVVVCGRTGSGKTSLLLALLQMLNVEGGTVEVDGVDLSLVPRELLRRNCFITVSQDGALLPQETLRRNLDPDGIASNDLIIQALVKVKLWRLLSWGVSDSAPDADADASMSAGAAHPVLDKQLSQLAQLSTGQTQLIGLARALVRVRQCAGSKPIILFDEITSNLDVATETVVYDIVKAEFEGHGHTVITVSHRSGVLQGQEASGYDQVVTLQDGHIQSVQTQMT